MMPGLRAKVHFGILGVAKTGGVPVKVAVVEMLTLLFGFMVILMACGASWSLAKWLVLLLVLVGGFHGLFVLATKIHEHGVELMVLWLILPRHWGNH